MAREINSRLRIYGTLQAKTPLHVGGYGIDVDSDLPLARNGKDEFYVSGTSITGILRAWCEKNFDATKLMFGFQEGDQGQASFVLIEDATVTLPKNLQVEIRDGVGIDRFYGTAADKTKFDRAVLPRGSKLQFEMTVEIAENEAETKAIIGHLLSALTNEEIRLGASKTRGLGRVKFELKEIQEEKLLGFDNILDLFDESSKSTTSIQDLINADKTTTPHPAKPKLEIEIVWKPRLPLMVKAGYEGIGVDMLPVTSGIEDERLSLVLAGSSIKGAFRSQAERIVRTLKDLSTKDEFNEQVKVPIVEEIFGGKKERNETNPKLGLGALSIDDCYSVESFDQTNWREVEQASVDRDETYRTFLEKLRTVEKTNLKFYPTQHTAIDRFTGGVADGALYSVLAPHNTEWKPIKMSLDLGRTVKDECCLMLLLLVLRDLAENRLPLGFATNRGMGEIEVEKIEITGIYNIIWQNGKFNFKHDENIGNEAETIKAKIQKEWAEWLKKQN